MSGGEFTSGEAIIGAALGGMGAVQIDGATSTWFNNGNLTISNGSLAITNGGNLQTSNVSIGSSGEIHGDGNIVGNVENNGGALRGQLNITGNLENAGLVLPGTSPGTLNIDGDYAQTADGDLLIELASPSSYDQLLASGAATLAGTIQIELLDDFVPSPGQSFTILTCDDVDGVFTTEMLPSVPGRIFDVIYNPTSVVLTVLPAFTADFDEDGDVDSDDLTQWHGDFGENALSDADNDGDSDGADFLAWQQQFGGGLPGVAASAAVPEPAMIGQLVFAALIAGSFAARLKSTARCSNGQRWARRIDPRGSRGKAAIL
jgi:T5SS/PEP-CTERM-associated repeat protein